MNENRPKGNQKHIDLSGRIRIEQGLNNGDSFRTIARDLNKDPSTISKEVRRHSIIKERKADAFAPIPCANNYDASKPRANVCSILHGCGDNDCTRKCVTCRKARCSEICSHYKPRKKKTTTSIKDRAFRKDRGYKEFLDYVDKNKPTYIVEMDTVEGAKGTKPCFLTMLFRNCKLMLMFLLEEQTQDEVNRVFDYLTEVLGIELFQKLFEVIITDNGHEFQDRWNLECDENGEIRTRIYYCDPNRSDQKGALEKNHEYIRYVLPKGSSFENITEETTLLLLNHINSEKRDSLNGHSPYEVSRILLDNRLHTALGLVEIPADEVTLIPALLK